MGTNQPGNMSDYQSKARRLRIRLGKVIQLHFDQGEFKRGFDLVHRFNLLSRAAGIRLWLTPGQVLDDWIETSKFERSF